jgi:sugar lactone lactonase YvrE
MNYPRNCHALQPFESKEIPHSPIDAAARSSYLIKQVHINASRNLEGVRPAMTSRQIFSTCLLIFTSISISYADQPGSGRISSPIGTGEQGFSGDGGLASKALLDQPFDVTFDSQGRILFSDTFNHRIRRFDPKSGLIETVVGSGLKGFSGDGGPALKAALNEPYGVKIDKDENLYIVDRLNFRVRRANLKTGLIETVAGTGEPRYSGDGGPASKASLMEPNGVALGSGPNGADSRLYIADVRGHRIRMVDLKSGMIETFAGTGKGKHDGDSGPASKASIFGARAVAVSPNGDVFILEREGHSLRVVDSKSGLIRTVAGTGVKGDSGDGGPAKKATFNGPKELCVAPDGSAVFVVDTENHKIRRVDLKSGLITTVAGNGQRGPGGDNGLSSEARLDRPHGVTVDAQSHIWIGDTNNHRIRKVTGTGH